MVYFCYKYYTCELTSGETSYRLLGIVPCEKVDYELSIKSLRLLHHNFIWQAGPSSKARKESPNKIPPSLRKRGKICEWDLCINRRQKERLALILSELHFSKVNLYLEEKLTIHRWWRECIYKGDGIYLVCVFCVSPRGWNVKFFSNSHKYFEINTLCWWVKNNCSVDVPCINQCRLKIS